MQESAPARTMADVLTGKNADAESTSVNTNPAEHTPVEQRVIDEYRNSTDIFSYRIRRNTVYLPYTF